MVMMGELSVCERGLGENRVKRLLTIGFLISIILICILLSGLNISSIRAAPMVVVVPDDYSTIQEAINNAPDGDTVFVKVGTYYEHVIINKTVSLVGEDSSATIIDGNGTGRVLDLIRDNVNITNFTVRGGGNTMFPDFEAGISLNNSKGCTIASNNVVDNSCFGIHLLNSDQNTISGNNLTRNAMYAIDLTTSSNNTISFNAATFNANIAIGMHTTSHDNIITGNTIVNNAYGIDAANVRNNEISSNYIANNSEIGIWIQDNANNNSISGNTITGSQLGIKILNSGYTEIFNNTIAYNFHTDEWNAGIRLDSASYSRIHSNFIVDNWRGVLLYTNSPHVSIYNNTIDDNEFGIRVASGGSSYLDVSDNIVMNNRGYGIGLTGFGGASNYATISRNIILNNGDGIALGQYSNYNTIVHNSLSQNGYGFYVEYSTQNTIWGNNIVHNDQQVYIAAGSINSWDRGYPSGGNYWSDYASPDSFRGPYQNVTGGDGIGDNPYVIDASNMDNYPFMLLSVCNVSQTPEGGMIPPADEVRITATITHLYPVERALLNYTTTNSTGTFHLSLNMTNAKDDVWNATIPAFPLGTNVTYIIIVQDSEGNTISSQQQGYAFEYQVIPEFSYILMLAPLVIITLLMAIVSKHKTRALGDWIG